MFPWTRREVLKSGLAAGASLLVPNAVRALADVGATADEALAPHDALADGLRERIDFDADWRFKLGKQVDPEMGFEPTWGGIFAKGGALFAPSAPQFDVSTWRALDLPHDWAIELPFVDDPRTEAYGFKPLLRDYPDTSIGWYRKTFTLPSSDAGRRLSLEFDGVFRDCTVALNGFLVGRNLSGYAPFRFDITDLVHPGSENVLVVRVDASEHEGWFYEGAGIYRHVWLVKTSPVHVPQWGTYVTSDISGRDATVRVVTEVANDSNDVVECRVIQTVLDPAGRAVARMPAASVTLRPWSTGEARQQTRVADAALWSPDTPSLYRLATEVAVNGAVVDRYESTFGIHSIRFDANDGFFLNGERVEIKGTCNHQDHTGVGSALPDRIQYYRIERLKEMGSNAYRTSHNAPTPELLDACDRLGMMVLDENRMFSTGPEVLDQLERLVRRDRNRACVIAWSIENEEPVQGSELGGRIGATMVRLVHRLDPSRPVTAAMNGSWGKGVSNVVDVQGFNYNLKDIDPYRAAHPSQRCMGTEVGSTVSTRGIYDNDPQRGYVSAYDVNAPSWASLAETWWPLYAARRWLAGGFVWTGFDYRGEPTPYSWPCINSHFGILDTCGFPKDNFYYYQAWWGDKPVLHLFPHWNWSGKDGQEIEVWCHSNLDRVELFLNGRSLGARDVPRNLHVSWQVPYAPGRLEARGFRGADQVLVAVRETTGPAVRIGLVADRTHIDAGGKDVAVITTSVLDPQGREVPTADHAITFTIEGDGRLRGVGNGDPSSHESDLGPTRRAFNGRCMGIVQSSSRAGAIRVRAVAEGLEPAVLEIATV